MAVDNAFKRIVADKDYMSSKHMMFQPASKAYAGTIKSVYFKERYNLKRTSMAHVSSILIASVVRRQT